MKLQPPFLYRQRSILNILNSERRLRHIELRNVNKHTPSVAPGDIVIVRKQVKSDAAKGISVKILFRTKGPYRVIEQVTPSSYHLQKLPFLQGLGIQGKIRKESAARMTRLPSTLVIHKRANGVDTRFSQLNGPFEQMPIQKWLRAMTDPGAYTQSNKHQEHAFEPLHNMWSDHIDTSSDDSSTTNDETTEPNTIDHTNAPSSPDIQAQPLAFETTNTDIIQKKTPPTIHDIEWPTQQPIPHLPTKNTSIDSTAMFVTPTTKCFSSKEHLHQPIPVSPHPSV
jgi:hypothetical protein